MKKSILISVGFIFLLAIGFVMSCQKQEINQEPTEQTVIDPVLMKILNFKDKVENPKNIKSGEMMSVDSAVWYIEAALNYTYCVKTEEYKVLANSAKDTIKLDINNEFVSVYDVIQLYFDFDKEMNVFLKQIKSENKDFEIVDLWYNEESQQLEAEVTANYGEEIGKYIYTIIGVWEWGQGLGMCDGTYPGEDLTTEIKKWIKYNRAVLNVTWSDVSETGRFASDYGALVDYDITNLILYDVHMFFFIENGTYSQYVSHCIGQTSCNEYAYQTKIALDVIEDNFIPSDKRVVKIGQMEGTQFGSAQTTPNINYLAHWITAKYGTPVNVVPTR